jgi:DNA-binding CsgD family transcriptional regulator
LTARENEFLPHIAEGLTYKELAEKFKLSIKTVDFHLSNIRRKTGAKSNSHLISLILRR